MPGRNWQYTQGRHDGSEVRCSCSFCFQVELLRSVANDTLNAPALLGQRERLLSVAENMVAAIKAGRRCAHYACRGPSGHVCRR